MTGELHIALIERLRRDELLNPMLGKFDDRAAIFGYRPPPSLEGQWEWWPQLVVDPAITSSRLEDKDGLMGEFLLNIYVYAKNNHDPSVVLEVADYLFETLGNGETLDVPGYHIALQEPDPPVDVSSDDFLGRSVQLRVIMQ